VSYCPLCGSEYRDSIKFCTDCQQNILPENLSTEEGVSCLNCGSGNYPDARYCWNCGVFLQAVNVSSLPFSFQGEVMQCHACGADTPVGVDFCVACGYMLTGARSCYRHPEQMTRYVCLICRKPLCTRCGRKINGKFICDEDAHYHIAGNWCTLLSDDDESALNPAMEALNEAELYTVVGSQSAGGDEWAMGLFSESMRAEREGRFRLLVPLIQVKDAERVLVDAGFLFENVCGNCGHEFNGSSYRCPQCGEEFIE